MCTESSHRYIATKSTYKVPNCTIAIALGSVQGNKDVSTDSEQVGVRKGMDWWSFLNTEGLCPYASGWLPHNFDLNEVEGFMVMDF